LNGKTLEAEIYNLLIKGDMKVNTTTASFSGLCLRVGLYYQDFKPHIIIVDEDSMDLLDLYLKENSYCYNLKKESTKVSFYAFDEDFSNLIFGLLGKGIKTTYVDGLEFVDKVKVEEEKKYALNLVAIDEPKVELVEHTKVQSKSFIFNPANKTPEEQATWLISTYVSKIDGKVLKASDQVVNLNPGVKELINQLEAKLYPTYSDYRLLKSNGSDEATKLNKHDFRELLTEEAYVMVDELFTRDKDKKAAYRWLCRGVTFKDAICKAIETGNVELENFKGVSDGIS
jgi:hypothetical protein